MNPEQHSTPSKKRKILTDGDEVIATISGPPSKFWSLTLLYVSEIVACK